MILNRECIRQILLIIEQDIPYNYYMGKDELLNHPKLDNFTEDEILYAILRLDESGYINCDILKGDNLPIYQLSLNSLTWDGHEFLDNIRDNKVWSYIKSKMSQTAQVSLPVLAQFAAQKGLDYLTTGHL